MKFINKILVILIIGLSTAFSAVEAQSINYKAVVKDGSGNLIANDLIDQLYDNAKLKEAKYNKHVKVHRNILNRDAVSQMTRRFGSNDEMLDFFDEIKTA